MSDNLVLEQLRLIRSEIADLRTLTLANIARSNRIERRLDSIDLRFNGVERRFSELRDDLELMIKAELMGRLGNFEQHMEARLDAMADRMKEPPGN